jgi:hypothetical protein
MRQLGLLEALHALVANGVWLYRGGGRRRAGLLRRTIHEQTRHVVDGRPVNQRLQKARAGSEQGQERDEDEPVAEGPRQFEQHPPRAPVSRRPFSHHVHRPMVATSLPLRRP